MKSFTGTWNISAETQDHVAAMEAWRNAREKAKARTAALESYDQALYWLKYALPKLATVEELAKQLMTEGQRVLEDEEGAAGEIHMLLHCLRDESGWVVNYLEKLGAKR